MFYRRISVPIIPFFLGGQLQFQAFSDFPVNYILRNSPSKCHWIRYFSSAKIVEKVENNRNNDRILSPSSGVYMSDLDTYSTPIQ